MRWVVVIVIVMGSGVMMLILRRVLAGHVVRGPFIVFCLELACVHTGAWHKYETTVSAVLCSVLVGTFVRHFCCLPPLILR